MTSHPWPGAAPTSTSPGACRSLSSAIRPLSESHLWSILGLLCVASRAVFCKGARASLLAPGPLWPLPCSWWSPQMEGPRAWRPRPRCGRALGGTRRVGGLLGVAGRLSGTVSPFRAAPAFLPGESQGRWSLMGCRLWGQPRVKSLSSFKSSQHSPALHPLPQTQIKKSSLAALATIKKPEGLAS